MSKVKTPPWISQRYAVYYYSIIKRDEIVSFGKNWMETEVIILNKEVKEILNKEVKERHITGRFYSYVEYEWSKQAKLATNETNL